MPFEHECFTVRPIEVYAETVTVLRDVSARHAATAAKMSADTEFEDCRELAVAACCEALEELEDAALRVLCRLVHESSVESAFGAIEAAGAGWLREVILNRAIETAIKPTPPEVWGP
jgi:hypothetical protein